MKSIFFTLSLLFGLGTNLQAETIYSGTIDLTKASNHAEIPTEINAGAYSVEVTLDASKADLENNIPLSRTTYRDDNEYVCNIEGAFKVGVATIKVKSLVSNWESTNTQDVLVRFGSSENDSACVVDSKVFEGTSDYIISPNTISLELPIKDARFTSIKLNINPIIDGFKASYELTKGDIENTLKVLNPGQGFESALENAGNKKISYALSLTANGYYHFDTKYTSALKVK